MRVLFVAEAPPASLDRYFYFAGVSRHDSLWACTMRALYPDFGETRHERSRKAEWLQRFSADGCWLHYTRDYSTFHRVGVAEVLRSAR